MTTRTGSAANPALTGTRSDRHRRWQFFSRFTSCAVAACLVVAACDAFLMKRRNFFPAQAVGMNNRCDFRNRPVYVPTAVNSVPTDGCAVVSVAVKTAITAARASRGGGSTNVAAVRPKVLEDSVDAG